MTRLEAGLFGGVAALVVLLAVPEGGVAQNAVRGCVQVQNASGQMVCPDVWTNKGFAALTNSAVSVKASQPGILGFIQCYNPNATAAYVQLFDVATAAGVTLGTTVPVQPVGIPATSEGGFALSMIGLGFRNGIQIAATTTATGSSALGAAITCGVGYN